MKRQNLVRVNTADERKFATLALFLDQKIIRNFIEELRGYYLTDGKTLPYDNLEIALSNNPYQSSKEELAEINEKVERLEWLKSFGSIGSDQREIENLDRELIFLVSPKNRQQRRLNTVLSHHISGKLMEKVILAATLFNEVGENEYSEPLLNGQFLNISDARERYWLYELNKDNGLTYEKMLDLCEGVSAWQTIEKQVKSYKRRLSDYSKDFFLNLTREGLI